MNAEENNPTLFKEMKMEYMSCFKASDANNDGLLDMAEFKVFIEKTTECAK